MLTADQSIGGAHPSERIEAIRVSDLHAFYGESHALHGIDFTVYQGELVTLLGRNGAGRTTTLRSMVGLLSRVTGSIVINGREVVGVPAHTIAHLGVGYCPEERGIFSSLNVEENLMLPPRVAPGGMTVEEIYAMFPNLKERRRSQGTRLSGGEQQMLAMARILRTGASILLLDEITEGLAPVICRQAGRGADRAEIPRLHHRAGRTELPLRRTACRPSPHHGPWPHRRHGRPRRAGGEAGGLR